MQENSTVVRVSVDEATYKKFRQLLLKDGETVSVKLGAYISSYVNRRSPDASKAKTRSSAGKKNSPA
jgi:hypothetical protein